MHARSPNLIRHTDEGTTVLEQRRVYGDHYHWSLLEAINDDALEPSIYIGSGWLDDFVAFINEDAFGDTMPRTLLTDEMGTVQALVDPSGDVLERYEYGPYGELIVVNAATDTVLPESAYGQLVNFQGHPALGINAAVQGLVEMRFRTYSPGMGRFITRDPIGVWGDVGNYGNNYTLASSNLLRFVDPLGLMGIRHPIRPIRGPSIDRPWYTLVEEDHELERFLHRYMYRDNFSNIEDWLSHLRALAAECGCLKEIVIDAHCGPGYFVLPDGQAYNPFYIDRMKRTPVRHPLELRDRFGQPQFFYPAYHYLGDPIMEYDIFRRQMEELGSLLCSGGTIVFAQCEAGATVNGEENKRILESLIDRDVVLPTTPVRWYRPPGLFTKPILIEDRFGKPAVK